jgi:hypothetical protein
MARATEQPVELTLSQMMGEVYEVIMVVFVIFLLAVLIIGVIRYFSENMWDKPYRILETSNIGTRESLYYPEKLHFCYYLSFNHAEWILGRFGLSIIDGFGKQNDCEQWIKKMVMVKPKLKRSHHNINMDQWR